MSSLWLPRAVGHWNPYRRFVAGLARSADLAMWRAYARVDKFAGDVDEFRARWGKEEGEAKFARDARLIGFAESHLNLLTTVGVTALWTALTNGSATVGPFANATAALGVGDSTTVEGAGQTNLQALTNAYRQVMDATFPTISGATITFKSTVGTTFANFHWQEWAAFSGVGSGSPPTGGTMLNRKTVDLGTKTSAASWALTTTIALS